MRSVAEVLGCTSPCYAEPLTIGDEVMIGEARGPVFVIVYVDSAQAWIRPLANGQEGLVALERLRKVSTQ